MKEQREGTDFRLLVEKVLIYIGAACVMISFFAFEMEIGERVGYLFLTLLLCGGLLLCLLVLISWATKSDSR